MLKRTFLTFVLLLSFGVYYPFNSLSAQREARVYTLQNLFEIADSNSTEIKSRILAIKEAEAGTSIAKNNLTPEINISANGSLNGNAWMADRDFSNGKNLVSPRWGNSASISIVQPLYTGGAISNDIQMAELRKDLANLDLQQTKQSLHLLICGYYLDIYRTENLIAVCESNISRTRQVIADMQAKQKAGTVLENDITRYEVQLQNLNYRKTELSSQAEILNYQLVTLLNLPAETKIEVDTSLLDLSLQEFSLEELQNGALTLQPMILKSQKQGEIVQTAHKITKSSYLPNISLIAEDHLGAPITFELPPINKNLNTYFIGIGISYNLSNLYKTDKQTEKTKTAILKAENDYQNAIENSNTNIYRAYIQYKNSYDLYATCQKSLELAEQNYSVSENRYKNDLALIIDLLDADNLLQDAQTKVLNARINIIYHYYNLLYASGRL